MLWLSFALFSCRLGHKKSGRAALGEQQTLSKKQQRRHTRLNVERADYRGD
jgi:hypothetical protein